MGGLSTVPMSKVRSVFIPPGPIFEIDTDEPDYFRGARAMHAGGFRPGDVVYNTFSYHLTPAGIMMESALRALGCAVVPAASATPSCSSTPSPRSSRQAMSARPHS